MLDILKAKGFGDRWITWIKLLFTFASSAILLNGVPGKKFYCLRGVRQGDPLSPYLFLLCSEGLSCLLAHEEDIGGIEGILVCRNAPSISHLLFIDDSLILIKAHMDNAQTLKRILDLYCGASGQLLSLDKSSVFFGPNTDVHVKTQILCFAKYHDRSAQ